MNDRICNSCSTPNEEYRQTCVQCGESLGSLTIVSAESNKSANAARILGQPVISPARVLELMHGLRFLANTIKEDKGMVFEGFDFIFIMHFLVDLLGFTAAFRTLGLDLTRSHFFQKQYLYPHRQGIADQLASDGADVQPLAEKSLYRIVSNILAQTERDGRRLIIVEDGGYIVPLIHRELSRYAGIVKGAVEQTTKGLRRTREVIPLRFPVMSVADSRIKLDVEPPLIAAAVWANVNRLLFYTHLFPDSTTTRVLIIGYGTIGKCLASHVRNLGFRVSIFDADVDRRDEAKRDGFTVCDDLCQLPAGDERLVIIGATGNTSIDQTVIGKLKHNSVLVSASSDQVEIGWKAINNLSTEAIPVTAVVDGSRIGTRFRLASNRHEITVLADGFPINFWNSESMPPRMSQVAMVPLFLSAVTIASGGFTGEVTEPNSQLVDELVQEYDLYNLLDIQSA